MLAVPSKTFGLCLKEISKATRRQGPVPEPRCVGGPLKTFFENKMGPSPNIIPRFDLERAKLLLQRGRRSSEVIAAAERIGADQLKHAIELYIGSSQSLKQLQQRELGIRARR